MSVLVHVLLWLLGGLVLLIFLGWAVHLLLIKPVAEDRARRLAAQWADELNQARDRRRQQGRRAARTGRVTTGPVAGTRRRDAPRRTESR